MMTTQKIPSGWTRDPISKALVMADVESVDERIARLENLIADLKIQVERLNNREVAE